MPWQEYARGEVLGSNPVQKGYFISKSLLKWICLMALLCETQDVYCIVSCKMCVSGCSAPSWIRALKTFPRRNISSLKWPNWIRLPATFLWPTNQDRAKTENFSNLSKQEKQQRSNKTWSPISKSIRQSFNGKLKFCFFGHALDPLEACFSKICFNNDRQIFCEDLLC